jgi:hypothetical protein
MLPPEAVGKRLLVHNETLLGDCNRIGNAPLVYRWLQPDWHAIGLGHSMMKAIGYGTRESERMLIDYTGATGAPLRLCDMFDEDDGMELLSRVDPGE